MSVLYFDDDEIIKSDSEIIKEFEMLFKKTFKKVYEECDYTHAMDVYFKWTECILNLCSKNLIERFHNIFEIWMDDATILALSDQLVDSLEIEHKIKDYMGENFFTELKNKYKK